MIKKHLLIFLMMVITLAACRGSEEVAGTSTPSPTSAPATPALSTPTGETVRGQAQVDSIQILMLDESFPVQVNVRVRGELADGCTMVDEVITQRTDNSFMSVVGTIRPGDALCTTEVVSFEELIALDVLGLDAGTYTVTVNGISGSFTLDVDNQIEEEATPTAEPTVTPTPPADTGGITGSVWHDLCAIAGGEGDEEAEPSEGCIALAEGGFQANGLLDAGEPGLEDIQVNLGAGDCPADGLATTTTDADGDFTFSDLAGGTYCVSINALEGANSEILLPGSFTFPDTDVNQTTVTVADGEGVTAVNFGWDYQFLPLPEVDPATCLNSVEFVEDLTLPDDTVLAPGEEFVKGWLLRNNGTCPWVEGYKIVTIDDEPLEGDTEMAIEAPVAPGQTTEVSVTLIAPEEPGTYRSNWQMNDADGDLFGVDGFLEDAFWLQIVVSETATPTAPESDSDAGSIGGIIWDDFCTIQADGTPTANCVETAEGSGFYISDGTLNGNEVGLAGVKVGLGEGACPLEGFPTEDNITMTTLTDEDGIYLFEGLESGTHCVFIDAFDEDNVNLLIPGDWSWPARGTGRLGIILAEAEQRLEVDFGWDYDE
jgi:inhibitor of cysteine peptidase